MTSAPTHYEILGLPEAIRHDYTISIQTFRGAYRRALLQNHPDKSQSSPKPYLKAEADTFSIDQISEAFKVLSNPHTRAKYDQELKLHNHTPKVGGVKSGEEFHTGIETVDLDDLELDEAQGLWYRSCRCGDTRGFLIKETDLEEAADDGELNVGCRGCSLWLRVLFGFIQEVESGADEGRGTS